MKIFCINETFLQNEGLKSFVHNKPITIIAGLPIAAKRLRWNSLDEFREDAFIKDTKALDSKLEIMEIDVEMLRGFQDMFPNEEGENIEYTEDASEADVLIARMFVKTEGE